MSPILTRGLLKDSKRLQKELGSRFAIVTDSRVAALYAASFPKEAHLFFFPAGEENKTRRVKESLEDQMFAAGLGKDTCLVAIGGGCVTDLGGFLAATYCRGLPLILIPTTLLGMVDAAIGGKTGVNTPYGKNLVGAFYPAKKVLIDPEVLATLPEIELRSGLVEAIKHGLVFDPSFTCWMEEKASSILALEEASIDHVILESCRHKLAIVAEDPEEKGKRRLLNYGHTVGHALEKLSGYALSHGACVALGILVESYISTLLGFLKIDSYQRICALIFQYMPLAKESFPFSSKELWLAMQLDKKAAGGLPRFVLLQEIGIPLSFEGVFCTPVQEQVVKKAWERVLDDLCCH